jgi:Uma2 family endonuclease
MSVVAPASGQKAVVYPESDGLPMSDNTTQFRWIVTIQGGLDAAYRDVPDVFVAGNLLWYPVEGDNTIRAAPDIFVAFGRPRRDRGSYLQWQENNIAPQVTFEIVSPGNRAGLLTHKFIFYEKYGVEEYYLWDPETGDLDGWVREHDKLKRIRDTHQWISPRLKIRFELMGGDLHIYGPDGKAFLTYVDLVRQREADRKAKLDAEAAKLQAETAKQQAETAKQQAEARAERLAAQLRALGIDPDK